MTKDLVCKPFLKWAGGKTKLLPELLKRVPEKYGTYHEPFLGGGALFFALKPKEAILSEINNELVRTYRAVRDEVDVLIDCLRHHQWNYSKEGRDHFNAVKALEHTKMTDVACAARMIFLNKTCFNGLYRLNKKGEFNVPMGKFARSPIVCDDRNLRACSEVLQRAEIRLEGYTESAKSIQAGDFVYWDPPYLPTSETSYFSAYTVQGFSAADHLRLAALAFEVKKFGADILVSNAGLRAVRDMYGLVGLKVEKVASRRSINCKTDKRGPVKEYVIS